tara:strand:+ start:208 stop:393 length:186 start_codon:yes stop_codon:yes gene_type:complete
MEYFWLTTIIVAALFLIVREMRRSIKGDGCCSCPSADSCRGADREKCAENKEESDGKEKDS